MEPKLMRLSVPRLWGVGDNKFYDVAPICSDEPGSDFVENWYLGFTEDVLWLFEWKYEAKEDSSAEMVIPEKNHYSINVGWHPDSRINGEYIAKLRWSGEDFLTVEQFISKDRHEVRDKIEAWMEYVTFNYVEAHNRFG